MWKILQWISRMKAVIVVWYSPGKRSFEDIIPLRFVGERNRKLGFRNDLDILFLGGYGQLEEPYKEHLIDLGFVLHDVSELFGRLSTEYHSLRRFGSFEFSCFMRWLVIDAHFSGEEITHYDGDVVFNTDPIEFSKKVFGKTFVLQGCPAVAVIHDRDWFRVYREQLDLFAQDVTRYSEVAWSLRSGWEHSLTAKWAGSRFRHIIGSDQDLLSHLIHADIIPQDKPEVILLSMKDYVLFENPLYIHETNSDMPFTYKRVRGVDYLNDRIVAFWHMQSEWIFYLAKFMNRTRYPFGRSETLRHGVSDVEDMLNRLLRKVGGGRSFNRSDVYGFFLDQNDFSDVMNNNVWWKKGVFR
jgi:hypothetical protein